MKKLFLYLLLFASLIIAIYSGYLLFTSHTNPLIGTIVLAVAIMVLFWSWSLVKKHRISVSSVVVVCILVVLLGGTTAVYAGYEPAVEMKDTIINKWKNVADSETQPEITKKPIILKEYFLAGSFLFPEVIELNLIQQWVYSSSKQLSFKSLNPPYVVNAAIRTKTSEVKTSLTVRVHRKDDPYKTSPIPITTRTIKGMGGRQAFIIEEKGDYIIDVKSVGCQWWAMVGHESEGIR